MVRVACLFQVCLSFLLAGSLSAGQMHATTQEKEDKQSSDSSDKAAKTKIRPEAAGRITIEVTGGTNEVPVDNASVYVKYVEERTLRKDKKLELNVKTSRDGVAHVPNAPMGRALVQVIAEGWKTYGRWYDITDVKQIIKIHLERPPKWY
jgi:hypothetical protein